MGIERVLRAPLREAVKKLSGHSELKGIAGAALKKYPKKMNIFPETGKVCKKVNLKKFSDLSEHLHPASSLRFLEADFQTYKQRLLRDFEGIVDKDILNRIAKSTNPEQLKNILIKQDISLIKDFSNQLVNKGAISNLNKPPKRFTLELEQMVDKFQLNKRNVILAREKALHVPSKNPQVIAIENILKEQYGCKFVSLKDNETYAKLILKAFEVAKKNNCNLPRNVIVTDFTGMGIANGERVKDVIMFNPTKSAKMSEGFGSTNSDFHIPLHEIIHGDHLPFLAFSHKKLPQSMIGTKRTLSGYSAGSLTHETFVELKTKKLIDGLNAEETELYNYLNFLS